MDAVLEAEKLMHQTEYYKHQFAFISNLEDRQNDMDFLYTLKLCYESGLSRAPVLIHQLQKGIFNSIPPKEPTRKLSTWIYLSGQYYSMHDAPGEAIEFSKDVKLKIINYLTDNFSKVIPSEDNQIYSFGMFFGRNIDLVAHGPAYDFLPDHIYNYMKSKRYFEAGLGQGAGEIFPSLDYPIQDKIVKRVEIDGEFAKWLGYGLGSSFVSLDKGRQVNILNTTIRKSIPFARGLGESLGNKFAEMPQELKEEIIKVLLINENFQFARGLGMGLGLTFLQLDEQVKRKIFDFITKSYQFAIGIGYGLGNIFPSLPKDFQHEIFERAEKNGELTRGLGIGLGNIFPSLPKDFQQEIFERAEKNSQFMRGLGIGLGKVFPFINKESQSKLFAKAQNNVEFAIGLGEGFGHVFIYIKNELRNRILEDLDKESSDDYTQDHDFGRNGNGFSRGLGIGLGKNFTYVRKKLGFRIFAKASANIQFAIGLGEGLGHIFFYLSDELQCKIMQKSNENPLARGLGMGLGKIFYYLHSNEQLQNKILEQINKNKIFANSLGASLSYNFSPLNDQGLIQKILSTTDEKPDYDKSDFLFNDYPIIGLPNNTYYYCTNKENEITDQNIIDDEMKEYCRWSWMR